MKIFLPLLLLLTTLLISCIDKEVNDGIIPPEVAHKDGYIKHLTPPDNFKSVTGWITAIHDRKSTKQSFIEIDYIRLYARVNGADVLLNSNEYNDSKAEGGLFKRDPWFGDNNNTPIPYEFTNNDNLVLRTSTKPDNVWHVWNKVWPRVDVPANAERCWLEVKCKITGSALIQLGIDYWKDGTCLYAGYNVNNTEAGVSDWYYKEGEWHIVTFAKP
ncbi:MAG: hypothetical protein WC780_05045 [Lentimicrobiaceae bacterium]